VTAGVASGREERMSVPEYGKVFVVGCPRSGTTWLRDIFGAHPRAVTSIESALLDFLVAPWQEVVRTSLDAAAEPAARSWRDPLFAAGEALLVRRRPSWYGEWRKVLLDYFDNRAAFLLHQSGIFPVRTLWVRKREEIAPYGRLLALIAQAEAAGGDHRQKVARVARGLFDACFLAAGGTAQHVFVEKTPSHLFHARFLLENFPEARIVEVVRDGRDVCVSMDSYKRWMPQDRKFQIWLWLRYLEEGTKLLAEPRFRGRVLRVKYEELKGDREAQLARIFAFSGLETSSAELARIGEATDIRRRQGAGEGKHYRQGAVGDWRQRMSPQDQDLFRRMAGRELARLGYGDGDGDGDGEPPASPLRAPGGSPG
jgi:hypothetical protein